MKEYVIDRIENNKVVVECLETMEMIIEEAEKFTILEEGKIYKKESDKYIFMEERSKKRKEDIKNKLNIIFNRK